MTSVILPLYIGTCITWKRIIWQLHSYCTAVNMGLNGIILPKGVRSIITGSIVKNVIGS